MGYQDIHAIKVRRHCQTLTEANPGNSIVVKGFLRKLYLTHLIRMGKDDPAQEVYRDSSYSRKKT